MVCKAITLWDRGANRGVRLMVTMNWGRKRGGGLDKTVNVELVPRVIPVALHNLPILPKLNVKVLPVGLPFHEVENPLLVSQKTGNL